MPQCGQGWTRKITRRCDPLCMSLRLVSEDSTHCCCGEQRKSRYLLFWVFLVRSPLHSDSSLMLSWGTEKSPLHSVFQLLSQRIWVIYLALSLPTWETLSVISSSLFWRQRNLVTYLDVLNIPIRRVLHPAPSPLSWRTGTLSYSYFWGPPHLKLCLLCSTTVVLKSLVSIWECFRVIYI